MNAPGSPSSPLQTTYFSSLLELVGELPLAAGGEARAAAAAQPGVEHLLTTSSGLHPGRALARPW